MLKETTLIGLELVISRLLAYRCTTTYKVYCLAMTICIFSHQTRLTTSRPHSPVTWLTSLAHVTIATPLRAPVVVTTRGRLLLC